MGIRHLCWLAGIAFLLLFLSLFSSLQIACGHYVYRISDSGTPTVPLQPRRPIDEYEQVVILLVGIDYRPGAWGIEFRDWPAAEVRSRSDVIMLVSLDKSISTATLMSIPRDTLVEIPGVGRDRLNMAFAKGGISLLMETIKELLTVRIDRFVIVDFEGFIEFVDAIGGVRMHIDKDLKLPSGRVWLRRGEHHLDGRTALRLVRHRFGERQGDISRIARQHDFLKALLKSVSEGGIARILVLIQKSPDIVKTDLTVFEILSLARQMRSITIEDLDTFILPGSVLQREYWVVDIPAWEEARQGIFPYP